MIEVDVEMAKLTLAIVVKSLFGADFTRESEEVGGLMVAVLNAANHRLNQILRLPSWVPTRRNLREKRALARLDEMLHGVITSRRATGEQMDDLLSVLLAAVDEEAVRDVRPAASRRDDDVVSRRPRNDGQRDDVDVVPPVAAP